MEALIMLSCVASEIREKQLSEINSADAKVEKGKDLKSIPNNRVTEYIENTSDELRNFSIMCKLASIESSKVSDSYRSDKKEFCEMKQQLLLHHSVGDLSPKTAKRAKQDMTISSNNVKSINKRRCVNEQKPFKRFRCSDEMMKSVIARLAGETEKTDEKNVHVSFDTDMEATNDILNTTKFGELEHTYARNAIPPVRVTRQKKKRRQNIYLPFTEFDLIKHLKDNSQVPEPITICTPPFPSVYTPLPLEAVCNVEFHSNGDPVDVKEPVFVQNSTSRIPSKLSRKKSKFGQGVNLPRSVLECIENRIACKSNASSKQNDANLPGVSLENSENVEEIIYLTALKNIRILVDQRIKRTYRDKTKKGHVCEICNKDFTADTSLIYHYLGHLKIKLFECNICDKAFTRRHSLKYHMMIHDNISRFQCQACGRLFRHPSHFKAHLRTHTDEKPFSCTFCPNKFKTRNSYKRHLKMQHQKLLTPNSSIVPILNDS